MTENIESKKAQIGVTGLAVMGANLARNLARNGYTVALHNRSVEKTDALLAEHGQDGEFIRTESLQQLVDSLESPRRILVMVKAGAPVDAVIEQLTPLLDEGDIVIDGGNSHFPDTIRRERELAQKGLHFVGVGVGSLYYAGRICPVVSSCRPYAGEDFGKGPPGRFTMLRVDFH